MQSRHCVHACCVILINDPIDMRHKSWKSKRNVAKFWKTNWIVLWQGRITKPFCRNCTDRNFICTKESWVNIRESFWMYLTMCRSGSVRAEIIKTARVSQFRDSGYLNLGTRYYISGTSLNYEFCRTWFGFCMFLTTALCLVPLGFARCSASHLADRQPCKFCLAKGTFFKYLAFINMTVEQYHSTFCFQLMKFR